jgi:hypothetical protein
MVLYVLLAYFWAPWTVALCVTAPTIFRHSFVSGHRQCHQGTAFGPCGIVSKYQTHSSTAYERCSYNWQVGCLPPRVAAVALAIAIGGEHLHNVSIIHAMQYLQNLIACLQNHHHNPTQLNQSFSDGEVDGTYAIIRLLHCKRLLTINSDIRK